MRIQHNIMAMSAYRNYTNNVSAMKKNLEKLSSGYKINRAGDDAAGLAISEKMRAQITGLETAQKNAKDGISLVQTAEGALTEVHDMLNRMVELATMSANGTYDNETDRAQLQKEMDQLTSEINRIADSANFNGIKLLDGSLDSTVKTINAESAEGFNIADWVGSTANNDAVVGDGTIVHTGGKKAQGTEFAIEFNNSTVAGKDGVSITIGENEKISLDGTEIAQGASAEDIAKAFETKLGGTTTLKSATGADVEFTVEADGDRLVFKQANAPATADEVVNGNMAVKYEGIGSGAVVNDRLNVTQPEFADIDATKNGAGANVTSVAFAWNNNATDEQKDALNKALGDGVDIKVTTTYAAAAGKPVSAKADLSKLLEALGDGYEITSDSGNAIGDKGVLDLKALANGATSTTTLKIMDKANGDVIGTIAIEMPDNNVAIATAPASGVTTVTLGAGNNQALNVAPSFTVEDGGKVGDKFNPNTGELFALSLNAKQTDALNQILADGDQTITVTLEGIAADNKAGANTKAHVELSQGLQDAGYYIATDNATPPTKLPDAGVATGAFGSADKALYLYDKDNNKIATITLGIKDGDALTTAPTTITLSKASFNKEVTKTNQDLGKNVQIKLTPAEVETGTATTEPTNWADDAATYTWHEGDKFSVEIDGKTYEVTLKNGGLTKEEQDSGKFIDMTDTKLTAATDGAGALGTAATKDNSALDMMNKLASAVQRQMNNEAREAAGGTEDYTEITGLKFGANANNAAKIDVTGSTTKYAYITDTAADDPDAPGATTPGGKDPNASTVNIKQGATASDGRLASTYIESADLAGLKDGSQLRVGDVTYTFAVGKDSKVTGDNVVDLTDMTADDADLLEKALVRLTETANPNAMFSVGNDEPGRVTFTENKDYKWGEGVDLSTHAGIAEQFGFYVDGATKTESGKALTLQIGDTAEKFNQLEVDVKDMHASSLGLDKIRIDDQTSAAAAVDVIKAAINTVSDVRGTLGATQNRLDHTINNLSVMTENIQDAESTIRDVDVAEEMMAYTKNNILIQSAQAMLAQANQVPQGVLQLLQ